MIATKLFERGLLPDWVVRFGIRRLLGQRLRSLHRNDVERQQNSVMDWVAELRRSDVTVHTDSANEQHYEVPAAFYQAVLGRHLKYSSGLWTDEALTLDDAEAAMLRLYCERGELEDGMSVLDLGCGWGSLTLWIAEHYPRCQVMGISNSSSQREFNLGQCHERGLRNVEIVTCDVKNLELPRRFDRAFSIEMFEHVRNYERLLAAVSDHLTDAGKLFVHIFTHRGAAYPFETDGDDNWMGRHFFTGGQMPSDHLLLDFQERLRIEQHWRVSGEHYGQTAEAWLHNFDRANGRLRSVFQETYGDKAKQMRVYWRAFFMACAELWGSHHGQEWFVSHYRFAKRP